jgi:DNA mismatch repair protein MutL
VPNIARLDPLVSSQIAAGEVVERPASALKELIENSLDAKATRIIIDFEDGGLSLLRVSDNGTGMTPDDAPLSVERFATSKLSTTEDLSRIATLGFRGEALPSIASCSRLTLETRAEGFKVGTEVRTIGGVILAVAEKGLPQGTTVTVRDLFFNTPARLKFVKSKASERQAIVDAVMRLALAWPDVSFTLRTGGKTIFATGGQGLKNAIQDIFGPDEAWAEVGFRSSEGVTISGFAGLPSVYRRLRDRELFAVNRRPVRDTNLAWALDTAYAGLIPPKTYPAAVLNIDLPPEEVDVNVHPTKSQVKFRNETAVKRAVTRAVSLALQKSLGGSFVESVESGKWGVVRDTSPGKEERERVQPHWPHRHFGLPFASADSLGIGPSRPEELGLLTADADYPDSPPKWQYLGSVEDTYLIASTGSSLLIIDKHALMESLTYRAMLCGESGSQDLLMAEMVRLDPKEIAAYEDFEEVLESVGFGCRLVGDQTVMVTSVPMVLGKALHPGALKEVLAKLSLEGKEASRAPSNSRVSSVSPERLLESARIETAACHASVRAREPLTREEACALIQALHAEPGARTCPHGRPVVRELTMKDMGDFFGRTSHATSSRV